ncbi:MAG: hypothetical protein ACRDPE_13745 [Solirubrobacterales bacterium]
MRLVHPSRKRQLLSVLAVLLLGFGASLLAADRDADARPAPGAVVPDGTYGGLARGSGEYVVFKVRHRRVRDLAFNTRILCQASDSSTAEPRFFSAAHAPQGKTIPRNGRLHLEWQEQGDGRQGNIGVTLHFGTRDFADLSVIVPEEPREYEVGEVKESCDGGGIVNFRRGFEVPALPTP